MSDLHLEAVGLVGSVAGVTAASPNEENLRHGIENLLEKACTRLGITWTSYQLDRTLRTGGRSRKVRFVDVVHGAVVIEYEPPRSFRGRSGSALHHAREQAEEYCDLLAVEEGRPRHEYSVVAWDGASISFGRHRDGSYQWDPLTPFDTGAAARLLELIRDDGIPLVHPQLLAALVGPESEFGTALLPSFFSAVSEASVSERTTKTKLLYVEWQRLFGQVVGIPTDALGRHLRELGRTHDTPYESDKAAYLFSLNTYIALVAKLVAAMALDGAQEDVANEAIPTKERMARLESGQLFTDAGIMNMLSGDFFSWYVDDSAWNTFEPAVAGILRTLKRVSFDVTRKTPESTVDLFKGLYMTFAPRALRHALGEFYTPDWLAAHALDEVGWNNDKGMLDPTCGTGTFLLQALRRRLIASDRDEGAAQLLSDLFGIDLNPLAVLAARASLVVFLANRLDPARPVRLPVFLADAINPARARHGTFAHTLQTEKGTRAFEFPERFVSHDDFFLVMQRIRDLIDQGMPVGQIMEAIETQECVASLSDAERDTVASSVRVLAALHADGWDGIWCSILADRFAAGAIPKVDVVAGNPPWVKWSHLPQEYAEFIKPRCVSLGIFSNDTWVGGIESDISTVITYEALEKYCRPGGRLAFFITGTVFANESSQGFRRWVLPDLAGRTPPRPEPFTVTRVEDYAAVAPFEGVSNHATLLLLERNDVATSYPVTYRVWRPPVVGGRTLRQFSSSREFREQATCVDLGATPVPGTDAGPWLKGSRPQLEVWTRLFSRDQPSYRARKGITTDANGIFFVKVTGQGGQDVLSVENDPSLGRRTLPTIRARCEAAHLFPLLRGEGVAEFRAVPDRTYHVLVPQRGMHGDPDLPVTAPHTHRYLSRFRETLSSRSSFKRFQKKQAWWSLWSTGAYTFSPFKVVWQELSGGRFSAAYIGSSSDDHVGTKVVIPDHKVYFVPLDTEEEAAFLTGFLNAPVVSSAVRAYAAALSLGVSVVEYLNIPRFDPENPDHRRLSKVAAAITTGGGTASDDERDELDAAVARIMGLEATALRALARSRVVDAEAAEIALA